MVWAEFTESLLHARFVRALPDEYAHAKETLQSMNCERSRRRDHSGRPGCPSRRSYRTREAGGAAPGEAMEAAELEAATTAGTAGYPKMAVAATAAMAMVAAVAVLVVAKAALRVALTAVVAAAVPTVSLATVVIAGLFRGELHNETERLRLAIHPVRWFWARGGRVSIRGGGTSGRAAGNRGRPRCMSLGFCGHRYRQVQCDDW